MFVAFRGRTGLQVAVLALGICMRQHTSIAGCDEMRRTASQVQDKASQLVAGQRWQAAEQAQFYS